MVRAAGVEPASHAWEAHIIPIYYARFEWTPDICERADRPASEILLRVRAQLGRLFADPLHQRYPRRPSSALFNVTASA